MIDDIETAFHEDEASRTVNMPIAQQNQLNDLDSFTIAKTSV
jgi:hypothetical protein